MLHGREGDRGENGRMNIDHFDDLLAAAHAQPQPQKLLLLFAGASLPADATPAQREAHARGLGGELEPLACVDKHPHELTSFEALVAEARGFVPAWTLLFTAALSGRDGQPPTDADTDAALQRMVAALKAGQIAQWLPFDRQGRPVRLG